MNYKDELRKLPKKKLIEMINVTPDIVEKCEVELLGGTHSPNINGTDGFHATYGPIEIKTQRWRGKYQLFGRAKFGGISIETYNRKLFNNELIIVTGYNEHTGQLYYRFSFRFEAIAPYYLNAVNVSIDKKWTNYDAIPLHYINHDTFKVEEVADKKVLQKEQHVFKPGFYTLLSKYC